jgi:hypothetical protein
VEKATSSWGCPFTLDAYTILLRMAFTLSSISFSLSSMSAGTTPTTVPHEAHATSLTPGAPSIRVGGAQNLVSLHDGQFGWFAMVLSFGATSLHLPFYPGDRTAN